MKFRIKSFFSLCFALAVNFSNAQESQDVVALRWAEGEYAKFIGEDFVKTSSKINLVFDYDNNKKLHAIKLGGDIYNHDDNPFNRFFYRKDVVDPKYTEGIYFTDKSIIVFKVKRLTDESKITLKACYGKKEDPEKAKEKVMEHLKSTYSKYIFKTVNYYEAIKSVEIVPVTKDSVPFGPNVPFRLGVITTFKNGQVLKTRNLKCDYTHSINDWTITQRTGTKVIMIDGLNYYTSDCINIKGGAIEFDLIPDAKFEGYNNQDRRYSKYGLKIPINCNEDNSITAVRAARFKEYDEIGITFKNKENVAVNMVYKRDSLKGYLGYGTSLNKIFLKTEPAFKLIRVMKNNKYGYADTSGKIVIPIEYDYVVNNYFQEKLMCVSKNDLYGYVNPKNEIVIPLKYKNAFSFSNGLAAVLVDGKWGYIDVTGKLVIPAIYDNAYSFNPSGVAIVRKGEKTGLISKSGTIILAFDNDKVFTFNSNDYWLVKNAGLYGIVNNSGKVILPTIYKEIKSFNGDVVIVQDDKSDYGYFHKDGKMLTECIYDKANEFDNGFAFVGRWVEDGYVNAKINTNGEEYDAKFTANSTSTSTTSTSSSGGSAKKSGTTESKSCFILNDLTQEQMGGKNSIKLGFTGFKMATDFIAKGKTYEVDCDDVIVYRLKNENSSYREKGYDLFNTKGKCGQTIKLSDYW